MTSLWTPSTPCQPGDRIVTAIRPTHPVERWAWRWLPPLRPLLRWLHDRRKAVPVEYVVTAVATSEEAHRPLASPEPPPGFMLRWSTTILWWCLVVLVGLPVALWLLSEAYISKSAHGPRS